MQPTTLLWYTTLPIFEHLITMLISYLLKDGSYI